LFKFITHKPLWANILAAFIIAVILVFAFFATLNWITDHANYEKVPPVVGQNVDAAKIILQAKGFNVEVVDSVYDNTIGALSIVKQSPDADALVKHGRTIFLTVNRATAPQVEMPNLIGFSIRSAQMYLASLGLRVGDTSYRPDIARNAVLEQLYNNQVIKPGTKIPSGTAISLVLGSGIGTGEVLVPDLIGLTFAQAKSQMALLNLNVGSVVLTTPITDSANAFVVKQSPDVLSQSSDGQRMANKIKAGQVIDIYLSNVAPVKDSIPSQSNN